MLSDEIREISGDVSDILSGSHPHDSMTYRGSVINKLLSIIERQAKRLKEVETRLAETEWRYNPSC